MLTPIGEQGLSLLSAFLEFIGNLGLFALRAEPTGVLPPFEWRMICQQIVEVGWRSLPIVLSSGFAVGLVLTLHTRSTLIRFGAESYIPTVQWLSFFSEIGPLVVGLLIARRVGAGIGPELAGMRVKEESPDMQFVTSRRRGSSPPILGRAFSSET